MPARREQSKTASSLRLRWAALSALCLLLTGLSLAQVDTVGVVQQVVQ